MVEAPEARIGLFVAEEVSSAHHFEVCPPSVLRIVDCRVVSSMKDFEESLSKMCPLLLLVLLLLPVEDIELSDDDDNDDDDKKELFWTT